MAKNVIPFSRDSVTLLFMHLIFKAGRPEIQSKVNESRNWGFCILCKVSWEGKDEKEAPSSLSEQIVHRYHFSGYGQSAQKDKK